MLPTKGYFQDIECPYYDNSCGRPYCHFRHRKKQSDPADESSQEENSSKDVPTVPTYKPTPKSELAVSRSHIPISYVPDIIYRAEKPLRSFSSKSTFLLKPTYNPTPISLLTTAVISNIDNEDNKAINDLKQSMVNTQYTPKSENTPQYEYQPTAKEESVTTQHLEKHQYKPMCQNETNIQYKPTALNDIKDNNSSDIAYKPTTLDTNYNPAVNVDTNIDFENLDNEFQMIDEIIMSDNEKDAQFGNNHIENKILEDESGKKACDDKGSKKQSSKSHRHNGKHDSKSSDKKSEEHKKSSKTKNHGNDRKHSTSSSREEKRSSSRHDKKHSRKDDYKKEKDDKTNRERSKHSEKDRDKNRSKDRERHKSSHKDETKKSKDKDKSEHAKKYDRKEEKNKHKSSKSENEKYKNSGKTESKRVNRSEESEFDLEPMDDSTCNSDFDMDIPSDGDETMQECLRIFNEYKPTEVESESDRDQHKIVSSGDEQTEECISTKKRIAHSTDAPCTSAKFQHPKPKPILTPGQIMSNRFKIAKSLQSNNEEKFIIDEVKRVTKRPAPTNPLLEAAKKHKLQKLFSPKSASVVDDIINGTKSKPIIKKISPVVNAMNIQRAKAQLDEITKKRAAEQLNKTAAQTNKFGKRQAHIPEYSLDNIPDVLDADKSKLPVNVRTRFLTMLADECCKLYLVQSEAYKRALQEEYGCYQKCKVIATYRNSAMLAVNRIRKELQEREQKNLGPIGSDESSSKTKEDSQKKTLYNIVKEYVLTKDELDIHGYPRESSIPGRAVIKNRKSTSSIPLPKNQKKCSRCSKIYLVDDKGKIIYKEECLYHPLKKRTIKGNQIYLCCKSTDDFGCATSHTHVSEMSEDAELEGFQTTLSPEGDKDPRSVAIYALDCEMCYTTKGLELTRVTIVDTDCKTVYESLVKPLNEIIDYNTRFSGITKQQMDRINTGILQVQANILHLCNSKTILIGHSLESDMKALKIVHETIVDTSVLFPHKMGLPHKRALRTLASDYLKKIIQNDVNGHDSAEDAITCMELVKWKVKEENKFKNNK